MGVGCGSGGDVSLGEGGARRESVRSSISLLIAPPGPLAAGLLLSTVSERTTVGLFAGFGLALWGTLSPSIRYAASLDKLDDVATRRVSPAALRCRLGLSLRNRLETCLGLGVRLSFSTARPARSDARDAFVANGLHDPER